MAEGRYVLVYHEDLIANFPEVWRDDKALATWLRLLALADKLWPSPADLPRGVSNVAVKGLVAAGLISVDGHRFSVRGLDAYRKRRSDAARNAAGNRWHGAESNAAGIAEGNAPASPKAMPHTDTRPRPQSGLGNGDGSPSSGVGSGEGFFPLVRLVEELTNRTFGYTAGSKPWQTLQDDVAALGAEKVEAAYRETAADAEGPLDAAGVIYGGHKRLYRIPDAPPRMSAAERKAAEKAEILERIRAN